MKSRVRHVSYVLNFLDVDFNSDEISTFFENKIDDILKTNNQNDLSEWEVRFRVTYTNAKKILISKNRFGTYPSEKYKEVTIVVPIPKKEIVFWGVINDQYIYSIDHYDGLMKNFNSLEVNFHKYNNRKDYIIDTLNRVLIFCFEEGIVVNGTKITAQFNL